MTDTDATRLRQAAERRSELAAATAEAVRHLAGVVDVDDYRRTTSSVLADVIVDRLRRRWGAEATRATVLESAPDVDDTDPAVVVGVLAARIASAAAVGQLLRQSAP